MDLQLLPKTGTRYVARVVNPETGEAAYPFAGTATTVDAESATFDAVKIGHLTRIDPLTVRLADLASLEEAPADIDEPHVSTNRKPEAVAG